MKEPVLLWYYFNAPEWAQNLHHPDDCDWIAITPPGEEFPDCIDWNRFGCCKVYRHVLSTGHTVYAGYHA